MIDSQEKQFLRNTNGPPLNPPTITLYNRNEREKLKSIETDILLRPGREGFYWTRRNITNDKVVWNTDKFLPSPAPACSSSLCMMGKSCFRLFRPQFDQLVGEPRPPAPAVTHTLSRGLQSLPCLPSSLPFLIFLLLQGLFRSCCFFGCFFFPFLFFCRRRRLSVCLSLSASCVGV